MPFFKYYNKHDILSVTHTRRFETRIGERLQVVADANDLSKSLAESSAKFVVLGIPEDIGVKANYGSGGTETAWEPFAEAFANIQSNDFLDGSDVLMLGCFDFTRITGLIESNAYNEAEKVDAYRHAVNQVDEVVEPLIKLITQHNKIPVVIGGGNNNAYPLIKGAAKGLSKAGHIPLASINCINLAGSPGFGALEGRHSGNAFSYAEEDGFLQKYCVVGIQENCLTQNTWMDVVNNPFIDFITCEDIFIHEKRNFLEAIAHATTFTDDTYTGIEVDLDCMESACGSGPVFTSGIEPLHARQFVSYTAGDTKTAYLHICPGTAKTALGSGENRGKLIAYLVSDFLKAKE